jgi:hypothetical protein
MMAVVIPGGANSTADALRGVFAGSSLCPPRHLALLNREKVLLSDEVGRLSAAVAEYNALLYPNLLLGPTWGSWEEFSTQAGPGVVVFLSCSCCGDQIHQTAYWTPQVGGILCPHCASFEQAMWRSLGHAAEALLEVVTLVRAKIAKAEDAISTICKACALLYKRLRTVSFESGISFHERGFFIHLAAHPPTIASVILSGLFEERDFQLPTAA